MCRLAVEAHELPAENEVKHGNHEWYIDPRVIVFVMK